MARTRENLMRGDPPNVMDVVEAGKVLNIPTRQVLELVDDGPLERVFIEHRDGGLRVNREQVEALATGKTPLFILTDVDTHTDFRYWDQQAALQAVHGRVGEGHAWEVRVVRGDIAAGGELIASGINSVTS